MNKISCINKKKTPKQTIKIAILSRENSNLHYALEQSHELLRKHVNRIKYLDNKIYNLSDRCRVTSIVATQQAEKVVALRKDIMDNVETIVSLKKEIREHIKRIEYLEEIVTDRNAQIRWLDRENL